MALELIGGAVLGAAVAELLKSVKDAKEKAATFHQALTRLESTLKSIIPRVNQIGQLNNKLNIPYEEMKEVMKILKDGRELVQKCSKVSSINLVRKVKHSKQLVELDYSLLRYFQTILPLDHFRDGKEMLVILRELQKELVGVKDEEGSTKSMQDIYAEMDGGQSSKSRQDRYFEMEVVGAKYECGSSKSMDDKYYEMEVSGAIDEGELSKSMNAIYSEMQDEYSEDMEAEDEDEYSEDMEEAEYSEDEEDEYSAMENMKPETQKKDSWTFNLTGWMYSLVSEVVKPVPQIAEIKENLQKKSWKFRLKGCTYNFDMEDRDYYKDGFWWDTEKRRHNVTDCECNTKHGKVMVISYGHKIMVLNSDFERQMEKVGNHPNIVPPIAYCFHERDTLLFYENFPQGSLYSRLHEYRGRLRLSYEYPVKRLEFKWDYKLKICLGVARGIAHLHSVKFIHGNLNSYNVLLTSDFDACISSYGLQYFSSATQKSDVHSFGLLLIEMISRKIPIEEKEMPGWSNWRDYCVSIHSKWLLYGLRKKKECKMLQIAMQCVEEDPDKRPTMGDVVGMLLQIS